MANGRIEASAEVWIGAREAINRLSAFAGGDQAAKDLLQDRLRDEQLRVRADRYLEVEEKSEERHRVRPRPANARVVVVAGLQPSRDDTNVEVPRTLWANSIDWDGDTLAWRWGNGEFFVTFRPAFPRLGAPTMRAKLVGAEFLGSEIEAIADPLWRTTSKQPSKPEPKKTGSGRPPTDWEAWIAELAVLVTTDKFKLSWSAKKIVREVNSQLAQQGLEPQAEGKVYYAAKAAKDRLTQHKLR